MASLIQRTFAGGEITNSLYARADHVKFQTGLRTCRNFFVMRHGGVANRPGSQFIAEVGDSNVRTYLAKFVFDDDQSYVIEVGSEYFRFYREGAQIQVSGATAWSGATAYVAGNVVSSGGANYYCILAHTNHAPGNTTYWYAMPGTIFQVPTPYLAADLASLRFEQSGDVVTITQTNYQPRELRRTGHTAWTLALVSTVPSIAAPANLAAVAGTAGALTYAYKVTAVKAETYEESEPSASDSVSCLAPDEDNPNTLTWDAVDGAVEYNVYCDLDANGTFGFIGTAGSTSFNDPGIQPDMSVTPPVPRPLFNATDNYPAVATHYQQRRVFAGSNNEPETARASKTGFYSNYTITSPIQDDDAVTWTHAGSKVNHIRHMIEVGLLVVLTSNGEWVVLGDPNAGGALLPTAINPKQRSHHGASRIPPIVIGQTIIYVQDRGQLVRDLVIDPEGGQIAQSRELTLFAAHLVDDKFIERMDFAQVPHSIGWFVRNDGVLLGLTYLPEEELFGWHRHDTGNGDVYEDVCVIPEFGVEDAPYVIVKRTINGQSKRYIERFPKRRAVDIRINALFLDSYLTYNGINTTSETMVLSSSTGWTTEDTVTVKRSSGGFISGDVGNAIAFLDADDQEVFRINIEGYSSTTIVTGRPNKTVPEAYRGLFTTMWARAVDTFAGLSHLEHRTVSILADGNVLAPGRVAGGAVTVDRPYMVAHVGLPIQADFETLDMDIAGSTLRDHKKLPTSVQVLVNATRGLTIGPDADHLLEYKGDFSTVYGRPPELISDIIEVQIEDTWNQSGRFLIRHDQPLPLEILAAIPNGKIGG